MLEFSLFCLAIIIQIVGIVGCFVPVLPGPIFSYCSFLLLLPTKNPPSVSLLVTCGIAVIAVTILDYVVPIIGAKKFNCSKYGLRGCTIGTILGMFFMPIGVFIGPFLGAFIGELIYKKTIGEALWGGLGAFVGFLLGVFLTVIVCLFMLIKCFSLWPF